MFKFCFISLKSFLISVIVPISTSVNCMKLCPKQQWLVLLSRGCGTVMERKYLGRNRGQASQGVAQNSRPSTVPAQNCNLGKAGSSTWKAEDLV